MEPYTGASRSYLLLQLGRRTESDRQIAARLVISAATLKTHLERAYPKVGVRSRRELIAAGWPGPGDASP